VQLRFYPYNKKSAHKVSRNSAHNQDTQYKYKN
jgi:hypothetical protein